MALIHKSRFNKPRHYFTCEKNTYIFKVEIKRQKVMRSAMWRNLENIILCLKKIHKRPYTRRLHSHGVPRRGKCRDKNQVSDGCPGKNKREGAWEVTAKLFRFSF